MIRDVERTPASARWKTISQFHINLDNFVAFLILFNICLCSQWRNIRGQSGPVDEAVQWVCRGHQQ